MRIENKVGMQPWPQQAVDNKQQQKAEKQTVKTDGFERTERQERPTYDKPKANVDAESIQKLQAQSEAAYGRLRELVEKLLARQGHTWQIFSASEELEIEVDATAQAEAQALLEEGAELSAQAVSDRIVGFAQALAGDNPDNIPKLRTAIEAGFAAAAEMFGGVLPDISFQTYDMIIEKLDAWENELRGSQEVEL